MIKSLTVVGARKGGVGKTTTTKLLTDYLMTRANGFRVFDGEAPGGSLRRSYPEAEIVDFHSTAGRMRVLDGLGDRPTLIDLPAGLLAETLQLLSDAGMLAEAREGKLHLSVIHVLGPSVDSVGEAADIAARLTEGGDHYVVHNCVNDEKFEQTDGAYARAMAHIDPKGIAHIGHLEGTAREAADLAGGGFAAFALDESRSTLLRRLVLKWQNDAFKSFDLAGFRALAVG